MQLQELVHDFLDAIASEWPDRIALLTRDQTLTYGQLKEQSERLANYLHSLGVKKGDRVATLLPNSLYVVVAIMAASRLGALYVVLNWQTRPYHLGYILEDAQPQVLLTLQARCAEVRELHSELCIQTVEADWARAMSMKPYPEQPTHDPQSLASLIYTSGSTGKPKAVMSRHSNICFVTRAIQQCLKMQASDIIGLFLPLAHDYGLYQIFLTFQVGAALALDAELELSTGPLLLQRLNTWNVTGLPLVPNLAEALIRLCQRPGAKLPKLRYITNTGMHLPRAYIEELQRLFPLMHIYVMFGQTECKRISILDPHDLPSKIYSVGRPLPGTACLIVDQQGNRLPPNTPGELVVRGPHVMPGYWNSPELTEKRFRRLGSEQEPVLFTGDICTLDEEGFLYFLGRQDDMYKQKGYRVSTLEVEMAALDIEAVRQAALVPDVDQRGAVLFFTGSMKPEEVLQQLRQRLEDAKVPERIVQVEQFPLTENGKTNKQHLKQLFLAGR
ncbi:MAG TPA: class I adenylate-forming enzyme family protein [Ktedonobacteraceae bacterium]|nr:class I adenylate-forming enzyme family protein [Ktedonobacteraceae bacterium]